MIWNKPQKSSKTELTPQIVTGPGKIATPKWSLAKVKLMLAKNKLLFIMLGLGLLTLIMLGLVYLNQQKNPKLAKADFQVPTTPDFHWCANGKFKVESVTQPDWDDNAKSGFAGYGNQSVAFKDIKSTNEKYVDSDANLEVIIRCESLPAFPDMAGRWKIKLSPNMHYLEKKNINAHKDESEAFILDSNGQYIVPRDFKDIYDVKSFAAVSTEFKATNPKFGTLTTKNNVESRILKGEYSNSYSGDSDYESAYTPNTLPYDNLVAPTVDLTHYVLQSGNETKFYEYDRAVGLNGSGVVSGVPLTFRIKYKNDGTKNIANAKLKIALDSELEYTASPCTSLTGQASGKSCTVDNKFLTVDLGTLNINDQGQVEYTAQVVANPVLGISQGSRVSLEGNDATQANNFVRINQEIAKVLMYSNLDYSNDIQTWWLDSNGIARTNISTGGTGYKLKNVYRNTGLKTEDYYSEDQYTNGQYVDSNSSGKRESRLSRIDSGYQPNITFTSFAAGQYEGNAIDTSGNNSQIDYSIFSDNSNKFYYATLKKNLGSGERGAFTLNVTLPTDNYLSTQPISFSRNDAYSDLNGSNTVNNLNISSLSDSLGIISKTASQRILKSNIQFSKLTLNQTVNGTNRAVVVAPDGTMNLNIHYKNISSGNIQNAIVNQTLDSDLDFTSSAPCTSLTGQAVGKTCVINGKTLSVDLGTINAGQEGDIVVSAKMIAGASDSVYDKNVKLNIKGVDTIGVGVSNTDQITILKSTGEAKKLSLTSYVVDSTDSFTSTVDLKPGNIYDLRVTYTNTGTDSILGYSNEKLNEQAFQGDPDGDKKLVDQVGDGYYDFSQYKIIGGNNQSISYIGCNIDQFSGKAAVDTNICTTTGNSFEVKPKSNLAPGESGTVSIKFKAYEVRTDGGIDQYYPTVKIDQYRCQLIDKDLDNDGDKDTTIKDCRSDLVTADTFNAGNNVLLVNTESGIDEFWLQLKMTYDLSKLEEIFDTSITCKIMKGGCYGDSEYNNIKLDNQYILDKVDNILSGPNYSGPTTLSKSYTTKYNKSIYIGCSAQDFVLQSYIKQPDYTDIRNYGGIKDHIPIIHNSEGGDNAEELDLGSSAYVSINPSSTKIGLTYKCNNPDLPSKIDSSGNNISQVGLDKIGTLNNATSDKSLVFGTLSSPVYNSEFKEYRVTYTHDKTIPQKPVPYSNYHYSSSNGSTYDYAPDNYYDGFFFDKFGLNLNYSIDLTKAREAVLENLSSDSYPNNTVDYDYTTKTDYTGPTTINYNRTDLYPENSSKLSFGVKIDANYSSYGESCAPGKFFVESVSAPQMNAPEVNLYTVRNRPIDAKINFKDFTTKHNSDEYGDRSGIEAFRQSLTQTFIVRCEQSGPLSNGSGEAYPALKGRYKITVPVTNSEYENPSQVTKIALSNPSFGVANLKGSDYQEELDFRYSPIEPFTGATKDTLNYSLNVVTNLRYSNIKNLYDKWYQLSDCFRYTNPSTNDTCQDDDYKIHNVGWLMEKLDNTTTGSIYNGPEIINYTDLTGKINVNIYDPKEANNGVECYPGKINPFNAVNDTAEVFYNGNNTPNSLIPVLDNDQVCNYTKLYPNLSAILNSSTGSDYYENHYDNFSLKILSKTGTDYFYANGTGTYYYANQSNSFDSYVRFDVDSANTTYPRVSTAVYEISYIDLSGQKISKTATVTVNVDVKCGGDPTLIQSNLTDESTNVIQSVPKTGNILFNDRVQTSTSTKTCGVPNQNVFAFKGIINNSLKINGQNYDPTSNNNLNFTTDAGNSLKFNQGTGTVVYNPKNLPSNGSNIDTFSYTISFDYIGKLPTTVDPSCTLVQDLGGGNGKLNCTDTATTTFNISPSEFDLYNVGLFKGVESADGIDVTVDPDETNYIATFSKDAFDPDNIDKQQTDSATFTVDPEINALIREYASDKVKVEPLTQPDKGVVSCGRDTNVYFKCTYSIPKGTPEGSATFKLKITYTDPDGKVYTRIQDVSLQVLEAEDKTCLNGFSLQNDCTYVPPPNQPAPPTPPTPPPSTPPSTPSNCGPGTSISCSTSGGSYSGGWSYPGGGGSGGGGGSSCTSFSCESGGGTTPPPIRYYGKDDVISLSSNNTNIITKQITIPVTEIHSNDFLTFDKGEYYKMTISKVQVKNNNGDSLGTLSFSDDRKKVIFTYNDNFAVVSDSGHQATGLMLMQQSTTNNSVVCKGENVSFNYTLPNQPDSPNAKVVIDCNNRILDCRLPDGNSTKAVAPRIVPDYASPASIATAAGGSTDILGLTLDSNANVYTLQAPPRSLYGGGGPTGQSNNQDALYEYTPLKILKLNSSTGDHPGSIDTITVNDWVGRPMDIDTRGFKPGADGKFYVFGLRKTSSGALDPAAVDNDLNGSLEGFLAEVTVSGNTGTITNTVGGLPAAGYAKDFADIAVGTDGKTFIDDSRQSITTTTNNYLKIPGASGAATVTFDNPNRFYDVGIDMDGKVYSLYGEFNGTTINNKTSINVGKNKFQTSPGNDLVLDTIWDGGDLEVANIDTTYASTQTKNTINTNGAYKYIYYTTGNGQGSDPAMVRVGQTGGQVVSNLYVVDSGFTSAATGYMDKIAFSFDGNTNKQDKQVIYYKNGNRTQNNPDATIGKIYCPDVPNPPPYVPGPKPNPGPDGNTPPGSPTGGAGSTTSGGGSATTGSGSATGDGSASAGSTTSGGGSASAGGGSASAGGSSTSTGGSSTSTGGSSTSTSGSSQGTPTISAVKTAKTLESTIIGPNDSLLSGQEFYYMIAVTNSGTADATNVVIQDIIDDDLLYTSGNCGSNCNDSTFNTDRKITWTLPTVAANTTTNVQVRVKVK